MWINRFSRIVFAPENGDGGGAAAPAADVQTPSEMDFTSVDTQLSEPERQLQFDPFENKPSGDKPSPTSAPSSENAPKPDQQQAGAPAPATPGSEPAQHQQQASPGQNPADRSVEQELALLRNIVSRVASGQQGGQAPQGQGQPTQQQQPAEPEIPRYAYNIPQELVNAIYSEDPIDRMHGLQAFVSMIGQAVHRQVRDEYSQQLTRLRQEELPSMMMQHQQAAEFARRVNTEFYSEFKELEPFRNVVGETAKELAREWRSWNWTPEFKSEVARRTKARLQQYAQASGWVPPQQQQPAPTSQPSQRPAMMPSGASPSRPGPQRSDPNDPTAIADLLF